MNVPFIVSQSTAKLPECRLSMLYNCRVQGQDKRPLHVDLCHTHALIPNFCCQYQLGSCHRSAYTIKFFSLLLRFYTKSTWYPNSTLYCIKPFTAFPAFISNVIPNTEQVDPVLPVALTPPTFRHRTSFTSECFVIRPVVFTEGQAGTIGESSDLKPGC